jgi:predicted RNase H-like HicB family nuclease
MLLQKLDPGGDVLLLFNREAIPPVLELVGDIDLAGHSDSLENNVCVLSRQRATVRPPPVVDVKGVAMSSNRHVVPNPDGGWDIKKPGGTRSSGHGDTQADAIERAKQIERKVLAEAGLAGDASYDDYAMQGRAYTWAQGERLDELLARKEEIMQHHEEAIERARSGHGPALAGQALLYPVIDPACDTPSFETYAEGFFNTAAAMRWYWDQYLGTDRTLPEPPWLAAPDRAATLAGLPPAVAVITGADPLRSEGEAYAARLAADGVPVLVRTYPRLFHGFLTILSLRAGASARELLYADLRRLLHVEVSA